MHKINNHQFCESDTLIFWCEENFIENDIRDEDLICNVHHQNQNTNSPNNEPNNLEWVKMKRFFLALFPQRHFSVFPPSQLHCISRPTLFPNPQTNFNHRSHPLMDSNISGAFISRAPNKPEYMYRNIGKKIKSKFTDQTSNAECIGFYRLAFARGGNGSPGVPMGTTALAWPAWWLCDQ